MTNWILWTQGTRGPYISVLVDREKDAPSLTEYERKSKICQPIKIAEKDENLWELKNGLDLLSRLYPPTGSKAAAYIDQAVKLEALANDLSTTIPERELAAVRAREARQRAMEMDR